MKLVAKNVRVAFAVLVALCVASLATAATDIKLRDRVAPRGSVVRLSDVADIATADRQQARQLGALPLMPAPAPGTERFLRTREIEDMLSAQGVEVGAVRFVGPAQVVIAASEGRSLSSNVIQVSGETETGERAAPRNRHAAILAGAGAEPKAAPMTLEETRASEIRQQVTTLIANHLNVKTSKVQPWKVECDLADRDLGKLNAAISTLVCVGGSEPWIGRQRFVISFTTADGKMQLPISAEVSPPPVPAVVAIRPVGRGEVVKAADVEMRMVEAKSKSIGQRAAADSIENLIGMEAKQAIQVGDIVFTDLIQSPVVVKRGDVITVSSQSGGIRVRTSGRAMRDAAVGELVQVEALGSREKYDARVTGPREAVVYSISRPASPEPAKRVDTARRRVPKDPAQRR